MFFSLAFCSFFSCQKKIVLSNLSIDAGSAKVSIDKTAGLLFTCFDVRGEMITVDKLSLVPSYARDEVMVTDPKQCLPEDQIFVADLTKKKTNNEYKVWVEKKGEWMARAMPQLSKLRKPISVLEEECSKQEQTPVHKKQQKIAKRKLSKKTIQTVQQTSIQQQTTTDKVASAKVIMYSTSWCPSCRAARLYFQTRKIPFVEFDIETNRQAASDYIRIQRANGLKEGVVPLLVINGRAFLGFSPLRVASALSAATN